MLLVPGLVLAQSLGDAARKEAERRKKTEASGEKPRVIGESDLQEANEEREREAEEPVDSLSAPQAEASPPPKGKRPQARSTPSATNTAQLDRERAQREREEQTWRRRWADANRRLEQARARYESIKDVYLPPGQYLVDRNGRVTIRSPEQLQRMVAEAKAEFDSAQKALDDLTEEARHEGVPPGWLR